MDYLEPIRIVERLDTGKCPICQSNLNYTSIVHNTGELENNGMTRTVKTVREAYLVHCPTCNYITDAVQIGLKFVPTDRICKFDSNWDVPYLEDNTIVYGEIGKNPFLKDKE